MKWNCSLHSLDEVTHEAKHHAPFFASMASNIFECNFVSTNIVNICIDAEVEMLVTSYQTDFKSRCCSIRCELLKSLLDKLRVTNFIPVSVEVPGLWIARRTFRRRNYSSYFHSVNFRSIFNGKWTRIKKLYSTFAFKNFFSKTFFRFRILLVSIRFS